MLNLAIRFYNKTEMVRHILEKYNADPAVRDRLGRNALETAAMHSDNKEVLDLILRHENVKIDGRDASGCTALHFAATSSNVVAVKHLIEMGANPNLLNNKGSSPLHVAAVFAKDIAIIDVLLNNKQVDVDALDNSGQNALCYAKCNQHGLAKEIVSRLEGNGFKNKRGSSSNTCDVLDPAMIQQYSNKEEGPSLLPVRRESDGTESKKQSNYSLSPLKFLLEASRYKFCSKRTCFICSFFSSLLVIFFLQTNLDIKRPVNNATTTFLLLFSNRQPKSYP
jgi:ankyrin repeat protein